MIIVSYGTTDKYTETTLRLKEDCESFRLRSWIELWEPFPGQKLYKPTMILRAIEKFGEEVMWVDADSKLLAPPKVGEFDFDFGWVLPRQGSNKPFACSVHFWSPSKKAKKFLSTWQKKCDVKKGQDHARLIETYKGTRAKTKDVSRWVQGRFVRNFEKRGEIWF